MKKIVGILILVALIAIIILQLKRNKEISENRIYHYDKEVAINVKAHKVSIGGENAAYDFTGTFNPEMEVKLNSDVQGKIISIFVNEGDKVRKGQALIKLDDKLLRLQLKTVNIQISGLETDVERYTTLVNSGAIEGVKLEKTELALRAAKNQRQTLLTTIQKTTIRAPFNGVITTKMTEVGAFSAPGIPLLLITNISGLKFTINVSESHLDIFEMDKSYPIKVDAYPTMNIMGKVIMIGSKGNMGNSFPVQFEVENSSSNEIKSNMFGRVVFEGDKADQSILIASSAIVGSSIKPQVYIIKDGKSVLQSITVSNRIQNKSVVSSGLKSGDVIVTSGFINIYDGANVKATLNK